MLSYINDNKHIEGRFKMPRTATKQREVNEDQEHLVMIGARVKPDFHQEVKEFAFKNNMSIAYLLERSIREFMDKYTEESEEKR